MILRKISGMSTACAWLTAWATDSSHSVRCGWISGAGACGRSADTPVRGEGSAQPGGEDDARTRHVLR